MKSLMILLSAAALAATACGSRQQPAQQNAQETSVGQPAAAPAPEQTPDEALTVTEPAIETENRLDEAAAPSIETNETATAEAEAAK